MEAKEAGGIGTVAAGGHGARLNGNAMTAKISSTPYRLMIDWNVGPILNCFEQRLAGGFRSAPVSTGQFGRKGYQVHQASAVDPPSL